MRFWDSSALVPLLVAEDTSDALESLFRDEQTVAVWWGAEVECASAAARLEREGRLTPREANDVFRQLGRLARAWNVIDPTETIRDSATRFLRVHDLRAADALQLAAALVAAEGRPSTLPFVCLDDRLCAAAHREGFQVVERAAL
ncbi:MAG: type II toxin-antitoxin system VapC family toxin [Acidobacteria bacterium]|nr:type II toxin-antitoxin system VapC family toxin [Acidobacteriota bacterium]